MLSKYALYLAVLGVFGLFSCNNSANKNSQKGSDSLQFAKDNFDLKLPDGFKTVVVAEDIGAARHIAVRDNGDIYIALNALHDGNSIVALRDTTNEVGS